MKQPEGKMKHTFHEPKKGASSRPTWKQRYVWHTTCKYGVQVSAKNEDLYNLLAVESCFRFLTLKHLYFFWATWPGNTVFGDVRINAQTGTNMLHKFIHVSCSTTEAILVCWVSRSEIRCLFGWLLVASKSTLRTMTTMTSSAPLCPSYEPETSALILMVFSERWKIAWPNPSYRALHQNWTVSANKIKKPSLLLNANVLVLNIPRRSSLSQAGQAPNKWEPTLYLHHSTYSTSKNIVSYVRKSWPQSLRGLRFPRW